MTIEEIIKARKRAPELTRIFILRYFKRLGIKLEPNRTNYFRVLHTRLDQMK